MSEERVTSGTDIVEEETDAGGQQHSSTGCFQISALCCCIPKRRMHLPGRQPKDRKKKNGKKKNAGNGSFGDTMFEGKQQNLSQDYWSMTSAGDLGAIQAKGVKPTLKVCIQTNDRKTQDPPMPLIPVTLTDICLEEKQLEYAETTKAKASCTQSKIWQQKEHIENVNVLSMETENRKLVGAVSKGVPFEDGKDCLVMPAKENRWSERPELLSSLFQGKFREEKQQQRRDHVDIILEVVPCKQELKQDHQDMSFQERQQPVELEFNSTLATNEDKFQEKQYSSTHAEGVSSSQELLNQPGILCNEEQQALGAEEVIPGVPQNTERPMDWNQMNFVSKEDANKEDYQDTPSQEAQQPAELKYPDILSTMCGNYEQEQAEVQQHQDFVTEESSNQTEHPYLDLHYQKDQPPVMPKAISFSFQGTSDEKKQEETQANRNSTSDTVPTKVEDHQCVLHQVDLQAAAQENITTLPLGATYTTDLQRQAYMNTLPEDVFVRIIEQKHTKTPQLLLLEQISTRHGEKDQQEAHACAYSGSKVIAYIEEQENQDPIVLQDTSILPDNVHHEKETPRKLECGDSGPEGIYDRKAQDHQDPVYLEMKQPLLLTKLSSLPSKVSLEEDLGINNDNTNVGKLEIHPLDEQPEGRDEQHKMHTFACSKEKAVTQEREEPQPTLPPQAGCDLEVEPQESWHFQKATSMPCDVQQKEQSNPGHDL